MEFQEELRQVLNKYSKENESDTPDYILADYLSDCLEAFNRPEIRKSIWVAPKRP